MPARAPNPIAIFFGIELRQARLRAAMTQQVLAERAEVDPVFVSFLENGRRQPSLTVVLAMERALNLAAGELVRRVAKHSTPIRKSKTLVGATVTPQKLPRQPKKPKRTP